MARARLTEEQMIEWLEEQLATRKAAKAAKRKVRINEITEKISAKEATITKLSEEILALTEERDELVLWVGDNA